MRTFSLLILFAVAALAGCTTYNTELHNPATGQKMTCHESNWGLIGGAVATTQHNNCVHDAIAAGFTE
jgi:hypothetical protein